MKTQRVWVLVGASLCMVGCGADGTGQKAQVSSGSPLTKAVRNVTTGGTFADTATASPGDTIEYSLSYARSSEADSLNIEISDQIASGQTFLSCSGGCSTASGAVSWPFAVVPAGETETVTFQVVLAPAFTDPVTTILNVGTVSAGGEGAIPSNQTQVIVESQPGLHVVKSSGGTIYRPTSGLSNTISYTLFYENTGSSDARNTVLTDTIPANTTFSSCTDNCTFDGTTVKWTLGTVAAHTSGVVSVTLDVGGATGCQVCNVAAIASPDEDGGAPLSSNRVCDGVVPGVHPEDAHASGSALGAFVGLLDLNLSPVSSSQSGVGVDSHSNTLGTGGSTGTISVGLLDTESTSTVSDTLDIATATSVASTADISMLNGVITATAVRAVASVSASDQNAQMSTNGSTLEGLMIGGIAFDDIQINTRITLPGNLGYVVLYEVIPEAAGAPYSAGVTVNMLHVHLLDILGNQTGELIVSQAKAHADFPALARCADVTQRASVSGHALIASALTQPTLVQAAVGEVSLPPLGGHDGYQAASVSAPPNGSIVSAQVATSSTTGAVSATGATSTSFADIADVCVLSSSTGCMVGATAIHVQSQSTSNGIYVGATADGTRFIDLNLLGMPITPAPNTVIGIPGLATVTLNEQICDDGATLAHHCTDGPIRGHAGLTVRAIHLVATVASLASVDVVVAEAHSDATFQTNCNCARPIH